MPFTLEAHYRGLQEEARAVAAEIEPLAAEVDAISSVHPALPRVLAQSGLCELVVPAAEGGRFERVDPLAVCLVREVLMQVSGNLDSTFALQGIGSFGISVAGSEEQRSRWLPKVARCEALAALALTEEDAGSDVRAVSTEVSRGQDGLVLNGTKSFISNAREAAFFSVFVREGDGFSLFLVRSDISGISTEPSPEIIAPHALGEVVFDGVHIEPSDRLGEQGEGFRLIMETLSTFRVSVAGAAIGLARAALEEAARHTGTREQFGRPLARLGGVAERLADSWGELEAARLLTYRAAELSREDPAAGLQMSSMAKLVATESAGRIVDRSVQVMGRHGLVRGSKIERLYRFARPMRIYEGASEALRPGIARDLVDRVAAGEDLGAAPG